MSLLAFLTLGASGVAAEVVTTRTDAVAKLLNEWYAAGTAAGLKAITYENRDGQHSPLNTALYPGLQVYKPAGKDVGAATQVRAVPTIGNCSMASGATQVGCLPRLYMMDPGGSRFLAKQYLSNNLFIYPEHEDYDIGANGVGGYGDLLPLNTPALLISKGSSYLDQPFVQAMLSTTAAFPPDTQKLLIEKRMLMPTLQSIFRRSNKMVVTPEDYFAGKAHPPVFDGTQIDEEKMVRAAHEMTPENLPAVVIMEIIEESKMEAGKNYFELPGAYPWQLADTPMSIGRVFRGNQAVHGLHISLEKSLNLGKAPVKLRTVLLQGDPRFVRIESGLKGDMRISFRWQPPTLAYTGIRSHRVDIGIFADNGLNISAPAIISVYMLPNEMHFYDDKGRISEIHYQTHNPDFGLPPSDTDPRWLRMVLACALTANNLRGRLVEQILSAAERESLHEIWLSLRTKEDAQAAAERDPKRKDEAARLRAELGEAIAAALKAPVDAKAGLTTRGAIEKVLNTIANFHSFYQGAQRELDALAASSPKATAAADIRAELHRLIMQGVLVEQASGQIDTMAPADKITLGERYMLRGLNLTLLSQVLFPEALERSTSPAYVHPRLTTPKQWRDVYRYDDSGTLQGWIRYAKARIANFDAEGRLLPDGPEGKAVPVRYLMGDNGTLVWEPAAK